MSRPITTARTIIVELTEAQYSALANAVTLAWGETHEWTPRTLMSLTSAWAKIDYAWNNN